MNRKQLWLTLFVLTLVSLFPLTACQQASAQDIQGLLQAIDGKAVVVTLADGSTARITIQDDKLAVKARDMVGQEVAIKVRADSREMVGVERLGEDTHVTGNIESIGANTWMIGGRSFQVNASTRLDGGLAIGVPARVEGVQLPDGTFLATQIETDNREGHFAGKIESIGKDTMVIGGKTFSTNAATRLDSGLVAGAVARVEFVTMPNGSMVAIEVETDEGGEGHVAGAIRSLSPDTVVINGQTFKINAATRFDNGTGIKARVEFIKLADGSLLASKIEFDRIEIEREREDLQRHEQELRGREQELERREAELRGREAEGEGPRGENEVRGREAEGEGPRGENEARGREAEGEGPRGENEARGREAEGEGPRGEDNGGLRGDGSIDDNSAGGSGGDDSGGGSSGSGK